MYLSEVSESELPLDKVVVVWTVLSTGPGNDMAQAQTLWSSVSQEGRVKGTFDWTTQGLMLCLEAMWKTACFKETMVWESIFVRVGGISVTEVLKTETSRGRIETLQGNPKLSGTTDDDGRRQGSTRTWLKLWCFASRCSLVLNLDGWRFGWDRLEFRGDNLCQFQTEEHTRSYRHISIERNIAGLRETGMGSGRKT